jgi:DNA-binding PadR family transcriptional regulator
MLLELVSEKRGISGYELNKLVEARGYRNWADIGTTSIYLGLEKLKKKGLMESRLDTEKTGRGPLPRRFELTRRGKEGLKRSVLDALENCRERDRRFDLALAGLPAINRKSARDALKKRNNMLLETARSVMEIYNEQGGDRLPYHARVIFKHSLSMIDHEVSFTQAVIEELK